MNRVFEENPAARTQDIYFTGHSLAGALAKLTALRYSITSGSAVPNQIKVIAFSPPNIGDKDFIEHVEEYRLSTANVLNFYSESDIVPRVPPSLLGYKRGIGHYIPIHALEISEHRIAALVSRLTGDSHISKVGAIIEANEIRRNKLSILAWSHGLYDELILKEFRNFQVQIRSNGSAGAAPLFSVRRPILKFLGWLVN